MSGDIPEQIEQLIKLLSRLPGLGPRSARRAALHLVARRDAVLTPLAMAMRQVADTVHPCPRCNNLATEALCPICADPARATGELAVVTDVAELWAMERSGLFKGRYHVLGGMLSALDDIGPEELGIPALLDRLRAEEVSEVILALPASVEGQSTAHYLADAIGATARVTTLAQGVPVGGTLDYLDEGTIGAALRARRPF